MSSLTLKSLLRRVTRVPSGSTPCSLPRLVTRVPSGTAISLSRGMLGACGIAAASAAKAATEVASVMGFMLRNKMRGSALSIFCVFLSLLFALLRWKITSRGPLFIPWPLKSRAEREECCCSGRISRDAARHVSRVSTAARPLLAFLVSVDQLGPRQTAQWRKHFTWEGGAHYKGVVARPMSTSVLNQP